MSSLTDKWMKKTATVSRISRVIGSNPPESENHIDCVSRISRVIGSNPPESSTAKPCEATRQAAKRHLKADRLSPGECARFCMEHQNRKGTLCPYINKLDGCLLWEAKNKQISIDKLEIAPELYLDLHQ